MSNLLDKASIILTPTAYNNGEALCIKPDDASGDFQFSRNSAATRVNAQGLVENVQILSSNLVQNGDFSEEGVQEVSNGSFSQEGAELVTNGDFATDSNWTKSPGATTSGGVATLNANASNIFIYQTLWAANAFTNKTVKVTYTIKSNTLDAGVLSINGLGSADFSLFVLAPQTVGTHSVYIPVLDRAGSDNRFAFLLNSAATSGAISIDNVSVREVGQDWNLGTGWSIGEDKAISDGANEDAYLSQAGLVAGKSYKVTFDILDYVSGVLSVRAANEPQAFSVNSNGSYVGYVKSISSISIGFRSAGASGFIGSITNISVKEVGQNWSVTDADADNYVEFGDGTARLKFLNTSPITVLQATAPYEIGKKYILTVDVANVTSGSIKFSQSGVNEVFDTTGVSTRIITPTGNGSLAFYRNTSNVDITLNSASLVEITDDTNLPRINYEGFSYQDALGSELVTNGSFDSDTAWTKGTNWLISNGLATYNPTGFSNLSQTTLGLEVGKTYKLTVNLIGGASGSVCRFYFGGSSSTAYSLVNGENTIIGIAVSDKITFRNLQQSQFSIDNVSVKEYLGQEVVPDSGCGSWLFEPQTTQLVPYSEDFSQYSISSSPIVTGGFLAPDGTNNAYKITNSGSSSVYLSGIPNLSSTSTRSIYARSVSGTGTATLMSYFGNTNNVFTLTEQWQRFEVAESTTTIGESNFYAADFRGSGTLTEYLIWGANATNDQDYATSYIPSNGSTATRNQDVCTNGGSLASINSTEGTLYLETATLVNTQTADNSITLTDGGNNKIIFRYRNTNAFNVKVFVNGVAQAEANHTLSNATDFNKIAVKWKLNDYEIYVNGISVFTDNNALVFPNNSINSLDFADALSTPFYGKTKCVAVWKEALSDQELAELTTI